MGFNKFMIFYFTDGTKEAYLLTHMFPFQYCAHFREYLLSAVLHVPCSLATMLQLIAVMERE